MQHWLKLVERHFWAGSPDGKANFVGQKCNNYAIGKSLPSTTMSCTGHNLRGNHCFPHLDILSA